MSERSRIGTLRAILARDVPGVRVGIGDDAAVLDGGLVWTVDAQVQGTHFRPGWLRWQDVGWRSFMAAASDLAAMGAEPIAALSSLVLAESLTDDELSALAQGQAAAADAIGAAVSGGNLARGAETSITTTLLGRAASPVLRSGARAGDGLWLAGDVGLAAAGLAALLSGNAGHVQDARIAPALAAWRTPRARIDDGRAMSRAGAHAAIDVSDGLACDVDHLAEASGVRVVLDQAALLAHAGPVLAQAAAAIGRDALDLALHGGEDYALVACSAVAIAGFSRIGRVEAGGSGPRVRIEAAGSSREVDVRGFDHFT